MLYNVYLFNLELVVINILCVRVCVQHAYVHVCASVQACVVLLLVRSELNEYMSHAWLVHVLVLFPTSSVANIVGSRRNKTMHVHTLNSLTICYVF